MTILAVDPGLRTFGWAVVTPRTGWVVELGLIYQENDDEIAESTGRALRVWEQARRIAVVARRHGCTKIAAEAMSFGGPPNARFAMAISLGLSWGSLAALAVMLDADLCEVGPKVWQRAIDPHAKGKVDYPKVFAALGAFVTGPAATDLERITPSMRNHALDAVGVGVFAALRPDAMTVIAGRADRSELEAPVS